MLQPGLEALMTRGGFQLALFAVDGQLVQKGRTCFVQPHQVNAYAGAAEAEYHFIKGIHRRVVADLGVSQIDLHLRQRLAEIERCEEGGSRRPRGA